MTSQNSGYDAVTYLLDRANLQDLVIRLYTCYDKHDAKTLAEDVLAPEIRIDYTELFGGEVTRHSGKQWADSVIDMCKAMSNHQHTVASILVDLPQPGVNVARPTEAKVTTSMNAHNVSYEARGGYLMQNGGRSDYDVVRIPELEAKGVNPWRVTTQKLSVAWEKGNTDVFTPVMPIMAKAVEQKLE